MAAIPEWHETMRSLGPHKAGRVESIAVALDAASQAKATLPVARRLARLYGATLHLVFVGRGDRSPQDALDKLGLTRDETRGAVLDALPGSAAKSIFDALERLPSPLLVMSIDVFDPAKESLMTEIAAAILNRPLRRIVLTAPGRGERAWDIHRVLLAHDGSPSTDIATAEAADVAHRAGADVLAIHVAARNSREPSEPGSIPAPRYIDQPQHEWPSWANEFLDRMIALGSPPAKLKFKLMVTGGQPGSEIAQFSRDNRADLVVAAWHGAWDALHGEVLRVIVRRAPCPVLLVHAPEVPRKPVR